MSQGYEPGQPSGYEPWSGSAAPPPVGTETVPGPPPPPVKKKGSVWGKSCLGCCGGCAVVGLILAIVVGVWVNDQNKKLGPINQQTVQQKLGNDVPIYPNAVLNEAATRMAAFTMQLLGQGVKEIGQAMTGLGAFETQDDVTKVEEYYLKEMPKRGWREFQRGDTGNPMALQRFFTKGEHMVMIQIQRQPGSRNILTIFRMKRPPGAGNVPSGAPGGPGAGR